ncbi:hypothetical protein CO709_09505 [Burkholderia thailandensis]|nr:hypothetical protein CO709_09505 [Burkholderia thailandensis]
MAPHARRAAPAVARRLFLVVDGCPLSPAAWHAQRGRASLYPGAQAPSRAADGCALRARGCRMPACVRTTSPAGSRREPSVSTINE